MLAAEWQDDGQSLHPVAYSVGGYYGPILPGGRDREEQLPRILAKLGDRATAVETAYAELPAIPHGDEYDWSARQAEELRVRECFTLTDEDADAARAFGCLLELTGTDGRGEHRYVTDREWLADRLVQQIAAHTAAETQRKEREREARTPSASSDDAEKQARREQRERDYEARVSARARNLGLGTALARWQPRLDTDAVKLLGSLALLHYGKAGSVGTAALPRAADDDEQARQADRPLPARRAGREGAAPRGDRQADAGEDARGRARGRPAPPPCTAAGRHRRLARR